ncbi:sugar ABC transporter permease [Jiella sp. MQZ9-1]|uniref:Sugar ABC transporter permease n=1 Tax=Jiella flava TaxID=2816857 RepID=A0A939G270_9HYPH|nr:sugar ABC transporter permease [Jiella flava]MBO0664213.1 sugar ABC transporter permease [Jiella flava]MCD2472859.1 sugar ABC transporter permease [Jiella flava]
MSQAFVPVRCRRARPALFLAPAASLLLLFFLAPIVIDVGIAFTNMGESLKVTAWTLKNFDRILGADRMIPLILLTTFLYVTATLFFFNVGLGVVLAITTTAVSDRLGALFRGIWILPRMSPAVIYALLWIWVVDSSPQGLLNQVVTGIFGLAPLNLRNDHPLLVIILANGFVGASFAMVVLTSTIRSIPEHLFHAARVDGASEWSVLRFVVLPSLKGPVWFITIYQALSLLVTFEYILLITNGGPVYDSTTYALYVYRRAFEGGHYAYGAALAIALMLFGVCFTLLQWRLFGDGMNRTRPRIEVL